MQYTLKYIIVNDIALISNINLVKINEELWVWAGRKTGNWIDKNDAAASLSRNPTNQGGKHHVGKLATRVWVTSPTSLSPGSHPFRYKTTLYNDWNIAVLILSFRSYIIYSRNNRKVLFYWSIANERARTRALNYFLTVTKMWPLVKRWRYWAKHYYCKTLFNSMITLIISDVAMIWCNDDFLTSI